MVQMAYSVTIWFIFYATNVVWKLILAQTFVNNWIRWIK